MRELAKKKLVHAAKDISNPGIVGTLGMLLDASKKGGVLNVTQIPITENASLQQWVCMYPGFGIVLTCDPERSNEIIPIFKKNKITAKICGEVQGTHLLSVSDGVDSSVVLDFKKDFVSGIPR